jgi:hypothetical protein
MIKTSFFIFPYLFSARYSYYEKSSRKVLCTLPPPHGMGDL